jgi:2-polyprenyl-3-methyl-5-hydroxy-6-metoxy-1,4-benzoquinol methylase
MRTKEDVFDFMLTLTTELFFELEKGYFLTGLEERSLKLLDVGCGNGEYLSHIHQSFPHLSLTGIEIDKSIYQKALLRSNPHLAIYHSSYDNIPVSEIYDWVMARLVILHIPDKQHFLRWLHQHTHHQSTILILDIDNDQLQENSQLPLFTALYKQSRQSLHTSKLLDLKDALRLEFQHAGFHHLSTKPYTITSDDPMVKQKLYMYMRLVTEYILGSPIPVAISEELFSWLIDPNGYHEIHMFGMEFTQAQ